MTSHTMPASRRYPLFRWAGVEIRIDTRAALLAGLLVWSLSQALFPMLYRGFSPGVYLWMGVAATLGLFASLVVHDLGQSLLARKYGLPVHGFTLFPVAGMSDLYVDPEEPENDCAMAVAGPLLSI